MSRTAGALSGAATGIGRWWFAPLPRGRVAALRAAVYLFIPLDLFLIRPWVLGHGTVPHELYHPLWVARLLHLPTPTPAFVLGIELALLVATAFALTGRWPRLAGYAVFVLYLQWMFIAFSYGKVDHDRVAFLVALAVLPSAGKARWGDRSADEASGWAIRCVQVAVVLTYFGSVFAKLRFGGINWITGATFMRAVTRRGTFFVEPLMEYPWVMVTGQVFVFAFEALSPLMLIGGRIGRAVLIAALFFHVITFASIEIMFWPHVVCLLAFLPLERLDPMRSARRLLEACSRRISTLRA